MNFCPNCGSKQNGGNFCANCGARLSDYALPAENGVNLTPTVPPQPPYAGVPYGYYPPQPMNGVGTQVPQKSEEELRLEQSLAPFEYEKLFDGTVCITKCKSKYETKLVVPECVSVIGENAFAYCDNLREIVLPEGLKIIGEYAFEACEKLKAVVLPRSLVEVKDFAFSDCYELETVEILNPETEFGSLVFFNTLKEKKEKEKELLKKKIEEEKALRKIFKCENDVLVEYCGEDEDVVIPDFVKEIGCKAFFENENIKRVIIPSSVTSIGYMSFENCENLTSVTIPNSVTSIAGSAFYGCSNLTSVKIPSSVRSIEKWAFFACGKIYCEVASKPVGWDWDWDDCTESVEWGCKI